MPFVYNRKVYLEIIGTYVKIKQDVNLRYLLIQKQFCDSVQTKDTNRRADLKMLIQRTLTYFAHSKLCCYQRWQSEKLVVPYHVIIHTVSKTTPGQNKVAFLERVRA